MELVTHLNTQKVPMTKVSYRKAGGADVFVELIASELVDEYIEMITRTGCDYHMFQGVYKAEGMYRVQKQWNAEVE